MSSASTLDGSANGDGDLTKPPATLSIDDQEAAAAAAADAADGKEEPSEGGKLKVLVGLLKKVVGVKDIAAIRFSLPATLLEPVPNLEYWTYLDRADTIATLPSLDDPLDRMLMAVRFALTKELKFVKGKVCKPYNSVLGEHFRCHWNTQTFALTPNGGELIPTHALEKGVDHATPLPLAARHGLAGGATASKIASKAPSLSSRPGSVKDADGAMPGSPQPADDAGAGRQKSIKRGLSKFLGGGGGSDKQASAAPSAASAATQSSNASDGSGPGAGSGGAANALAEPQPRRLAFLCEQVSHHPPISTFWCECAEAGVSISGVDQLSAKFTGASVKVYPGEQNKGIFVRCDERAAGKGAAGEEYQITHPTASINGFFRGSIWVAIADATYITCRGGQQDDAAAAGASGGEASASAGASKPGRRLRTIIEYKDESWVMKAKYALEGVVYEYDYDPAVEAKAAEARRARAARRRAAAEGHGEDGHAFGAEAADEDAADEDADEDDGHYTKIKQVPQDRIVATFEGQWRGDVTYKLKGEKESRLLIRLDDLAVTRKTVRPLSAHEEMESRKIWAPVTDAILSKQFSAANKHKQEIEQAQRDAAAERKKRGEQFQPRFFELDYHDGRPRLTEEGKKALHDEANLVGYEVKDGKPVLSS